MFTFRAQRFASLVIIILTLGAIAAITDDAPPEDCPALMRDFGFTDADDWVWSEAAQTCVNPKLGRGPQSAGWDDEDSTTSTPDPKELDLRCSSAARHIDLPDANGWVWSEDRQACVNPRLEAAENAPPSNASNKCEEGSLSKCLKTCNNLKPESSIAADSQENSREGCRASCNFRCGTMELGGCHKGYCWAKCISAFPFTYGTEWCYTSKASYSQSHQYVKCINDGDCNLDWRCAGPCAAF